MTRDTCQRLSSMLALIAPTNFLLGGFTHAYIWYLSFFKYLPQPFSHTLVYILWQSLLLEYFRNRSGQDDLPVISGRRSDQSGATTTRGFRLLSRMTPTTYLMWYWYRMFFLEDIVLSLSGVMVEVGKGRNCFEIYGCMLVSLHVVFAGVTGLVGFVEAIASYRRALQQTK